MNLCEFVLDKKKHEKVKSFVFNKSLKAFCVYKQGKN